MQNARLDEAQARIKIAGRNNNLGYADDTTHLFYGRKQRRTKEPLDESEESEKVGFKLNIQKTKIMASGPIISWEIGNSGNSVRLYFLGSKITADGDYSHEIKRHLLLGRKVMTNLDSILKIRDYFAHKGPSSQGYGFSYGHVWM